ncbi:UNVERIFIED_CONTAM: hypothetical protein FKN15_039645 [Acipenser sinensis]
MHIRELNEGGAPWCLAYLEYGHLLDVYPYEDPLFMKAFNRGKVENVEEWIRLKAVPSPMTDQDTCLTCLKGEEWCFAVGEVRHISHNQPPLWQELELPAPKRKKGRNGHPWKKGKKPAQAPAPMREERKCPVPTKEKTERPAHTRRNHEHPTPSEEIWDSLLNPEVDLMAIDLLWARDGEQWEA